MAHDTKALLAANLRRLRVARHLSLSELARTTRISKATLSGIENGHANPTIETLAALAAAMRTPLGDLLEELPLGEVRIVRAARDGREGERALQDADGLAIVELSLEPGQLREVEPRAAGSRAHLYVLAGKLLAGPVERISEFGRGDFVSFPADVPHQFEAGSAPARALLAVTG